MVRSNFDYTNRPSSGEKLGASIAGDLWKKAAQLIKISKEVKPSRGKPRKSITSHDLSAVTAPCETPASAGVEDAAGSMVIQKLDIKIPGKKLTDDGFRLVAEALIAALKARPDLSLNELDLSGNDLSVKSICAMTEIVRCAPSLHTLRLAENDLCVETAEDCHEWKLFIAACLSCQGLTSIDFHTNVRLGARAWELIAWAVSVGEVKVRERQDSGQHDDPTDVGVSGLGIVDDEGLHINEKIDVSPSNRKAARRAKALEQAPPPPLPTFRLVDIVGTAFDDAAAFFASNIMVKTAHAKLPIRFTTPDGNAGVGKDIALLLTIAETCSVPEGSGDGAGSDQEGGANSADPVSTWDPTNVASPSYNKSISPAAARRKALKAATPEEQLQRLVKKIQRNVIVTRGYRTVQLWNAGIQVFAASRKIFIVSGSQVHRPMAGFTPAKDEEYFPAESRISEGEEGICEAADFGYTLRRQDGPRAWLGWEMESPESDADYTPSPSPRRNARYWTATALSTPTGNTTDLSSPVTAPSLARLQAARQDGTLCRPTMSTDSHAGMQQSSGVEILMPPVALAPNDFALVADLPKLQTSQSGEAAGVEEKKHQAYLDWQAEHMRKLVVEQGGASDGYRDTSLRSQLPLTVGQRIISFTLPADIMTTLSSRQQQKAIEWAQLPDSLATEHDWRMKDRASQIWMLLECLECLEYD